MWFNVRTLLGIGATAFLVTFARQHPGVRDAGRWRLAAVAVILALVTLAAGSWLADAACLWLALDAALAGTLVYRGISFLLPVAAGALTLAHTSLQRGGAHRHWSPDGPDPSKKS